MHACARVGERKGVEVEKEVLCLSLCSRSRRTDAVLSLRIGIATRSGRITLIKQQLQGGEGF